MLTFSKKEKKRKRKKKLEGGFLSFLTSAGFRVH